MKALRRALVGAVAGTNLGTDSAVTDSSGDLQGDLASLCRDSQSIDDLESAVTRASAGRTYRTPQARLALLDDAVVADERLSSGPSNGPAVNGGLGADPSGRWSSVGGASNMAEMAAGNAMATTGAVNGISSDDGVKMFACDSESSAIGGGSGGTGDRHVLIGDVASSESTSLLDDSSSDDDPDAGVSQWHCQQSNAASSATTNGGETRQRATFRLCLAFGLCLCFMLAEVVGAYFSNSTAIYSDAAHMLTDLTGFGLSIGALAFSGARRPNARFPFGFYRIEILGAITSVLLIWVVSAILVYASIKRIQSGDFKIDADTMMIVSAAGVAMNGVMAAILHGSLPCLPAPAGSAHCHSHAPRTNINVRAAMVHVFGDLLQSVGVFISAGLIRHNPALKLADPVCTFIFSALVLATTVGIMRDACAILMEAFPTRLNYASIKLALEAVPGVRNVHCLRAWSLSMERDVLSAHLAVDSTADRDATLRGALRLLRKRFKLTDCTLQLELYDRQATSLCEASQI